ncbi:aldo/keto reductase [Kineococcus arenarius]|uniref:aldo/keto reductase n=1 Tax=Kineococcus sp. SYSU DK007 TaxID=3383128 RepID=UPI003D7E74DC
MAPAVPPITLNNGVSVPQLGFGVWQVGDDEVVPAVETALEAGYRHVDTAAIYGNEAGVGRALAQSGIARDELFVTTKLWNAEQGYDSTLRAFDASLERLGLDRVDLYLIHWPVPQADAYVDTWKAFEKIYADGRARAIGVSNFEPHHLRRLLDETSVVPAVNQVELHPFLQQAELRAADAQHGIVTEAYSPLSSGKGVIDDPVVTALARAHGKTPAQVVLRWHVQLGNLVIPKSVTPQRIRENIDVFDFELSDADVAQITGLDRPDGRVGSHPDQMNVGAPA